MNNLVLSLGSNLGDRVQNLSSALYYLKEAGITIIKQSFIYETDPWGNTDQPDFYNQVIEAETGMNVLQTLKQILLIEKEMGRNRRQKWEPRIIDIDILFFNDEIINEEGLIVPHQHLHERAFVLIPLAEILPAKIHPVLQKTISEILLSIKDDDGGVRKLKTASHE